MSSDEYYPVERRSTWSPEEDERLTRLVSIYGPKNWYLIAKELQTRNGKSCRSRWCNYLAPGIDKSPFRPEEEKVIQEKHKELGNRWSEIATFLPGRTDMSIKNYWNGHLKRKLVAQGQLEAEVPIYNSRVSRLEPAGPSTNRVLMPNDDDEGNDLKRARPNPPTDLYPQISNLSALQNCRSLPYMIALAALLIELREDDDPDALCQVIGIANDLLMKKKGASVAAESLVKDQE